jgi:hypothetical protein
MIYMSNISLLIKSFKLGGHFATANHYPQSYGGLYFGESAYGLECRTPRHY